MYMQMLHQKLINHVALVLDASGSMQYLAPTVIKVGDELIQHLAKKSVELDQETRVTVYIFDDTTNCVIFDQDVLRLPSLAKLYRIGGMTALIDATLLSIEDLRLTMQKYGDHAFLTYVLTDGAENRSMRSSQDLRLVMDNLRDNETFGVLVPNEAGLMSAKRYGFPEGNITIWETTKAGLTEAATKITRSVDTYMTGRSSGLRKSSTLFAGGAEVVNKATINSKNLTSLPRDAYKLVDVKKEMPIREYIEHEVGETYRIGSAFYQLSKPETIQAQKVLAVQNIHSGRIYTGDQVRPILGLSSTESARVRPETNKEYRIYVQSTSVNRKLVPATKLLILK